jgi:RNA 2',3'-cyclic 3'-phosphodiesterase
VKPELMHVTLAFLGQTPDDRLNDVTAAAEAAASDVTAFDIELDRPGRYPSSGKPRVVWLGIGAGAPNVLALGHRLRAELGRREIAFDAKPLRAHVTLGRVREDVALVDARAIAAGVEAMRIPHLRFRADAAVVFESALSPRGPRYTPRASAPLRVGDKSTQAPPS